MIPLATRRAKASDARRVRDGEGRRLAANTAGNHCSCAIVFLAVHEAADVLRRAATVQVIHSVAPAAHSFQSLAAVRGAIAVGVAVRGVRFAAAAIFIAAVALLRRERRFF